MLEAEPVVALCFRSCDDHILLQAIALALCRCPPTPLVGGVHPDLTGGDRLASPHTCVRFQECRHSRSGVNVLTLQISASDVWESEGLS